MRVLIGKDEAEASAIAAFEVKKRLIEYPDGLFAFPTGDTPIKMYEILVHMAQEGRLDFKNVSVMGVDELIGVDRNDSRSYAYYLQNKFFNHVNIKKENIYLFDGLSNQPHDACGDYNKIMDEMGGCDVVICGIGLNGHLGFNEPDDFLVPRIHVNKIAAKTQAKLKEIFKEDMPEQAITLGVADFLSAKHIIMIAFGEHKKEVVTRLLTEKKLSTQFPISFLHLHPQVTLITDVYAMQDLYKENNTYGNI